MKLLGGKSWFGGGKKSKAEVAPSPAVPVVRGTPVYATPSPATAAKPKPAGSQELVPCQNGCGWTAFPGHTTCCRLCKGPEGPHAKDCEIKNKLVQPRCSNGCGRLSFGSFATCCTKCHGPTGPHAKDCAQKGAWTTSPSPIDAPARRDAEPRDIEAVEQDLRTKLTAWRDAGAMRTPEEVDEVIRGLASSADMEPDAVRMLWLSTVRQARPVGGPTVAYIELAKKHHGIDVEVVDLGQYSAHHSNSCMFLTCAVSIADRRIKGYEDAELPGVLGMCLDSAARFDDSLTLEQLVEEHGRTRSGILGKMADALRHASCEVLVFDKEFYEPFFHPVRCAGKSISFDTWVERLRGSEEGDELVVLALARLCGMAIQPVQQSGYRVPLMDPVGAAETQCITFWGNDDHHWVWLRPKGELPVGSTSGRAVPVAVQDSEPPLADKEFSPSCAAGEELPAELSRTAKREEAPVDLPVDSSGKSRGEEAPVDLPVDSHGKTKEIWVPAEGENLF
mmetsp:Transcript_81494/g.161787  ORF Transcript_81494/g.161787 Transcript_81494/m.161787 type:complete len:506 (+) Transcript_81494:50-1567(+)